MNLEWRKVQINDGPEILTAILAEEIDELGKLAEDKSVLEVGAAHGYSAIMMTLAGGMVTSVDSHLGDTWLNETFNTMRENAASCGVRVNIVKGRFEDVLPEMFARGEKFDLVFVDGGSQFTEIMFELEMAKKLCREGGIIACHDYGHEVYKGKKKAMDIVFPDGPTKLVQSLFIVQM